MLPGLRAHTPAIPFPDTIPSAHPRPRPRPRTLLHHLIRKNFRRHQQLVSNPDIIRALRTGYTFAAFLNHAARPPESTSSLPNPALSQLARLLTLYLAQVTTTPAPPPPRRPRKRHVVPAPYPGARKVLEVRPRPLSELRGGRRHLPTLTATSRGVTFLRFKKLQSPFLSRVLRDRINQRQRWLEAEDRLKQDAVWAIKEDEWDQEMEKALALSAGTRDTGPVENQYGSSRSEEDRLMWVDSGRTALRDLDRFGAQESGKKAEHGRQLLEVWRQERALYVSERDQRIQEKKQRALARRANEDRSRPE